MQIKTGQQYLVELTNFVIGGGVEGEEGNFRQRGLRQLSVSLLALQEAAVYIRNAQTGTELPNLLLFKPVSCAESRARK